MGSQSGQPIVRNAVLVSLHQPVHRQTTLIHDLDHVFERQHRSVGGQGVILAHGMAGKIRPLIQRMGLPHLGDLRHPQAGHGHLGELGQKQHTLRVRELLTTNHHLLGVILHNLQHGKAQLIPGVPIRPRPHILRRRRLRPGLHAHALGLNPLTGERIERVRRRQRCGSNQHHLTIHRCGHLPHLTPARPGINAGALHHKLHLGAGQNQGQHGGRVLRHPIRHRSHGLIRIAAGRHQLRNGRRPHAMHNHPRQTSQLRSSVRHVNGVPVPRNHRKRMHGLRRRDLRIRPERSGRRLMGGQHRSIRTGGRIPPPAPNRHALRQLRQRPTISRNLRPNHHNPADLRVHNLLRASGHRQIHDLPSSRVRQVVDKRNVMLQMHQRQHALHHGIATRPRNLGRLHRRENRRPCPTHQHIRRGTGRQNRLRQIPRGHILIIRNIVRIQRGLPRHHPIMLNPQAAARRDPRQIPHGGLRIPINHLRHHIPWRHDRRSKPDSKIRRGTKRRGTRQGHGQHRLLPIAGYQRRPGRRMIRRRVLLGILPQLPRIHITQPGNHRRLMPARPIRAARRQHHRHWIREGIRQFHPTLEQKIDRSLIEPGQ